MIQRIQTIYLLAVIIISIFIFIPGAGNFAFVQSGISKDFNIEMNILNSQTKCISIVQPPTYAALIVLNSLVIVFALMAILKYRKRPVQAKLCYFNILLALLLFGGMWMFTDLMKHKTADSRAVYLPGFYLPPVQIILLFMAARSISKDEKLVRSADRLR